MNFIEKNEIEIQNWHEIARPEQIIPNDGSWLWMILAGRGFGKTRTGAENVMELVNSGKYKSIAIIGKTVQEARDIMVEGISGLLSTTIGQQALYNAENKIKSPDIMNFRYYRSRDLITWANGARAYLLGADNHQKLRGYQFDLVWMDEFAKYRHPEKTWEQILFTLRLGDDPKCIITTTPRPLNILKRLKETEGVHVTQGSTFDNKANLSERFLEIVQSVYQNSWIGRQELDGELLNEKQNSVWKRDKITYQDVDRDKLSRVVIGVDPAVTSGANSDETGIIVAGLGEDNKIYVLDDLSGKYTSSQWSQKVKQACDEYGVGKVVAETNNGGDLVRDVLLNSYPEVPFKQVRAIKGKIARAEPISMLYDSKRVYHHKPFPELEDQMCDMSYDEPSGKSPDRVDALVWAINELKNPCEKKEPEACSISVLSM